MDRKETHPRHFYQLSPHADKRNKGNLDRLIVLAKIHEARERRTSP